MTELDGQEKAVRQEMRALQALIRKHAPVMMNCARGNAECEKLWELRRVFSSSLRASGLIKLNEDIVVPRGRLEDLFIFTGRLQKKYQVPVACFGHAGDGNIHVNVMYDEKWPDIRRRTSALLDELFHQVLAWKGAITGEHGIGLAKKRWWPLAVSKEVLALHRRIKHAVDPRGILNPGKFV